MEEFQKDNQNEDGTEDMKRAPLDPVQEFLMNWSEEEIAEVMLEMKEAANDPTIPKPTIKEKAALFKRIFGCEMELSPEDREQMAIEEAAEEQRRYAEELERRKEHYERLRFHWRVAAMLATLVITFSAASIVGAVGKGSEDISLNNHELYTTVEVYGSEAASEELTHYYEPSYLPDGFLLTKKDVTTLGSDITYANAEGQTIRIATYLLDSTPGIDIENTIKSEIEIQGHKGYLYSNTIDSKNFMIIFEDSCMVCIGGTVEETELLKIAENISINKI